MRPLFGLALAGALLLGAASDANAQFSISIGNPYLGQGVGIGNPYYGGYTPYGSGYSGYSSYSSGYGLGVSPLTSVYSSGYSGYTGVPGAVIGAPAYGYAGSPIYGYPAVAVPYRGGYGSRNVYRGGGYYRPFGFRRW